MTAAIAILESVHELYGEKLAFDKECDLEMAIKNIRLVLNEPPPDYSKISQENLPEDLKELINRSERLLRETDELLGAV